MNTQAYNKFWNWFQKNAQEFSHVVKTQNDVEKNLFDKMSEPLSEIKEGIWLLTGMFDENTAELVFTADGDVHNFVYIEELVNAAPAIQGWKFTALKPALNSDDFGIQMGGYSFDTQNLFFYSNDLSEYPDEIDITLVYNNFKQKDEKGITNGVHIFLENYLGELGYATVIDNVSVMGPKQAQGELVPLTKLKDFLVWREKEFVEKYEGSRHDTENDSYTSYEATLNNASDSPVIAIMNSTLLEWDAKASHPWMMTVEIEYDGKDTNGMPAEKDYQFLDRVEEEIMEELKDAEGYLNLGRETGDNVRITYFACKDFRKPTKVLDQIILKYPEADIRFEIYKDKYWQSLNRFMQ